MVSVFMVWECGSGADEARKRGGPVGYNISAPPFVRQALFSRVVDNEDLRHVRLGLFEGGLLARSQRVLPPRDGGLASGARFQTGRSHPCGRW
jgi:hypothetical protein